MEADLAPPGRASTEEIQRQAKGVLSTSALYQLLNTVPEALLILNDKHQIVFANQYLLRLLEQKKAKSVYGARPGEILQCVHAAGMSGGCGTVDACRKCGSLLAILSSQRGKSSQRKCHIIRAHDGEALDLRVHATPLAVKKQHFTLLTITDISRENRRKILERTLLEDIVESAHKVQESAEEVPQGSLEKLDHFKDVVYQFSEHLVEGVNEHRILVAAENDELRIHPVQIGSMDILLEIINFYRDRRIAKGRHILIDSKADDVELVTDRILLKQVIGRMVEGALKACKTNDTVTLGIEMKRHMIEFSVHDPNFIPPEAQAHIFRRVSADAKQGRAFGTYIMKLLSEKYLRGRISFVSSEGLGTAFRAYYPLDLTEKKSSHKTT